MCKAEFSIVEYVWGVSGGVFGDTKLSLETLNFSMSVGVV